jgi:hypothetical protein
VKLDLAHRSEDPPAAPAGFLIPRAIVWRGRIWSVVGGSAALAAQRIGAPVSAADLEACAPAAE